MSEKCALLNSQLTLPCKHMILYEDGFWTGCNLMPGEDDGRNEVYYALCQALNPNLDTVTIKGVLTPTEISFTGNPDKGTGGYKITDYKSEVLSVERPEDYIDLDTQCPAGYDWKTVNLKFSALTKLCTIEEVKAHPEKVEEINRKIKRLFDARASGTGSCNGEVEG